LYPADRGCAFDRSGVVSNSREYDAVSSVLTIMLQSSSAPLRMYLAYCAKETYGFFGSKSLHDQVLLIRNLALDSFSWTDTCGTPSAVVPFSEEQRLHAFDVVRVLVV